MKQNKLFQILKSLNSEEWRLLRKTVISPLYNTNPTILTLFEQLRKQSPKLDSSQKGKEKLFEQLFPAEEYNDLKMRRLFFELTKVAETLLIHLQLERDDFRRSQLLTEAYGVRNIYRLFEKETESLLKDLENHPTKNGDYYLKKLQLKEGKYFHPQHNKYNIEDNTLEELTDSLDGYFAMMKMQLNIALKAQMKVLKKNYKIRFSAALNQKVNTGFLKDNPLFSLFQEALVLLEEKQEPDFEKYEQLLFDQLENLSNDDQQLLFYNGLNYAIRQSNHGEKGFFKAVFRWYQLGLEKKLVFQNNQLTETTFGNIVLYGCLQSAFEWVHHFIETYSPYLKEENREEERLFSMLLLKFYQGDHETLIADISDYSFSTQYILRTRSLLIRSYFELFQKDSNYYKMLHSAIISFENYLYKNELFTADKIASNLNLIRTLKGLSKRMQEGKRDSQLVDYLVKQVKRRKRMVGKQWLQEKLQLKLKLK